MGYDADLDAGTAVTTALRAIGGRMPQLESAALADEPDGVHQLRTHVRRVRSVLAAFTPVFDAAPVVSLRRRYSELGAELGVVRDIEVRVQVAERALEEAEGVPFVLNARTDAFLRGRDRERDVNVADAIERGRAYLEAGATCVFVPGNFGEDVVVELVAGLGEQRVSLIGLPDVPTPTRLEELGVARLSYGPYSQRVVLAELQDLASYLYDGGVLPSGIRPLN
ncbi:isocitrate lyase/phosphoenolpyruvate mutase family protein [Agromyces humi]|uniref:isocitrate lyase/phosphoenolpyruvate mutase family protein n=1 Tax=Agromyces humi TaxID=1766800 RepID=UPI00135B3F53|nr:isocitrate lyase/phosphoenolpyruvate mutase family protein [Agromyces humi]